MFFCDSICQVLFLKTLCFRALALYIERFVASLISSKSLSNFLGFRKMYAGWNVGTIVMLSYLKVLPRARVIFFSFTSKAFVEHDPRVQIMRG